MNIRTFAPALPRHFSSFGVEADTVVWENDDITVLFSATEKAVMAVPNDGGREYAHENVKNITVATHLLNGLVEMLESGVALADCGWDVI